MELKFAWIITIICRCEERFISKQIAYQGVRRKLEAVKVIIMRK